MRGQVDVRSARAAAWASLGSAAAIASLIAGKATRDALFLATHPIENLPRITTIAAFASLAGALAVARVMPRWTPARLAPGLLVVSAALFVGEWFLARASLSTAATVIFLHAGVLGPTTLSTFWSLINERFDPHTAKKVINRIGLGGSVGGVVGGGLAWSARSFMAPTTMLLALAGLTALAGFATLQLSALHLEPQAPRSGGAKEPGELSGMKTLGGKPYLRDMALLVALSAFGSGLLDYLVGAGASRAYGSAADLLTFFAVLHLATSIGTLVVQWLIVRPILARLGLSWSIALSRAAPILSALAYVLLPGAPGLVALRAPEAMLQSSLYRSGYELLYTPVVEEAKRATKTIIDVGADRLGVALAGGAAIVVVTTITGAGHDLLLLGLATLAFAGSLIVTTRLSKGYVSALESRLKAGLVDVAPDDVVDALTRRTLSGSTLSVDRNALLAEIDAFRRQKVDDAPASRGRSTAAGLSGSTDPVSADVAALRSADVSGVRAVLVQRRPFELVLVGHTIPLLARADVRAEAMAALRSVGTAVTGQLADALLDHGRPAEVRRCVAKLLGGCGTARSVAGLVGGLEDPEVRVRDACALALSRITEKAPELVVPKDVVVAAVGRELERGRSSLEHVFTLLSLLVDREPLAIAYRIVSNESESALRGTAIEYLDNVLPETVRAPLLSVLGQRPGPRPVRRPQDTVLEELRRSGEHGPVSFRGHVEEPEA